MQAPNSSTSMTAPIEAVRLLRNSCQALPSAVRQRANRPPSVGARIASRSANLRASSAVMACPLAQLHARIEQPVGEVDQEVHDHDDAAQHQHAGLDQRIVAL